MTHAPANSVRLPAHHLSRAQVVVDCLPAVRLLDLGGIVFVMGTQGEGVGGKSAEHCPTDSRLERGRGNGHHPISRGAGAGYRAAGAAPTELGGLGQLTELCAVGRGTVIVSFLQAVTTSRRELSLGQ